VITPFKNKKMNTKKINLVLLGISLIFSAKIFAQDDMLSGLENKNEKQYITNAFKSIRVINGHSMEFIGKGVLDVRILHRFGFLNSGFGNLFGLDQASMRFGFDYGVTKDLTIGIGRSTFDKEWDGFVKYRPLQQSIGGKHPSPISLVWVSGMAIATKTWLTPQRDNFSFYNELIVGRKFNEHFSAQIAPTHVHLNIVGGQQYTNDIFAIGLGARYKISKRTAFVVDYHYIIKPMNEEDDEVSSNAQFNNMKNPLAIGFDIETGGHVFQLHFTNSMGMNEKAFITKTSNTWGKGEISFGFNLSRVFTVNK
jgi:hypothetical protein